MANCGIGLDSTEFPNGPRSIPYFVGIVGMGFFVGRRYGYLVRYSWHDKSQRSCTWCGDRCETVHPFAIGLDRVRPRQSFALERKGCTFGNMPDWAPHFRRAFYAVQTRSVLPLNSAELLRGTMEPTTERIVSNPMPGIFKIIELVGTSPVSFAEAVKAAVAEASATVRHMDWFEVVNQRGRIVNDKVDEFQVTVKIGFKIER